jgi:hypothetical protein
MAIGSNPLSSTRKSAQTDVISIGGCIGRSTAGRQRAKARGVHMGRPSALDAHQRREALARREAGEAQTDIARTFGVSHTTIGRLRADA